MAARLVVLLGAAALVGSSCGGGEGGSGTELEEGPKVAGFEFTSESEVTEGEPIDRRFTCDGRDVSPWLQWRGAPEGTRQLALVVEDPDAPGATFTHWILFGIPPSITWLYVGVPDEAIAPAPRELGLILRQGENDFGRIGYGGPCPPEGEEHRYVFRLLALHLPLDLEPGTDRATFDEAIAPHIAAEARLTASYARP